MFSSQSNIIRPALAALLFAAVIFTPWWLPLALAIVLSARWKAWEVIVAGILFDLLWLPAGAWFNVPAIPLATIVTVLLVFIFEPLRRQLLL